MFKIGTALVTGGIAAFLTVWSAISAGARFFTAAGRSLVVFLIVAALVFLIAFLLEKQVPALFAQTTEPEVPKGKKGKAPLAANEPEDMEAIAEPEEDQGVQAEERQEQDAASNIAEEPVAVAPQGE